MTRDELLAAIDRAHHRAIVAELERECREIDPRTVEEIEAAERGECTVRRYSTPLRVIRSGKVA